jgi:4a-hydroxytetrahydrobiopterin dehydratase
MDSWVEKDNRLEKTFKFSSFSDAMVWMLKASYFIEKTDHHPEWTNTYNKVHVVLCTHSAGNTVTEKDRELAAYLDKIYS